MKKSPERDDVHRLNVSLFIMTKTALGRYTVSDLHTHLNSNKVQI